MMLRIGAVLLGLLLAGSALAQQPVVGFESGPSAVTGTPANSSHSGGAVVGPAGNVTTAAGDITNGAQLGTNQSGLFVVPWARITGGAGIVTQFAMTSSGGSTGAYVVRIWRKWPINTICQDNVAFSSNFAVDDGDLITPPFSVTPAAPAVTTGDANTYASVTVQTYTAQNVDQPATRNLYVCLQTVSTDTADENKPIRVMVSGPLD